MNNFWLIPAAALIIAANAYALAPALDSEYDSKQASIELHKLEIDYQASDKAREIKAANESLKRIKG